MKNTDRLRDLVEARHAAFVALADRVFDTPEVAYTEYRSAEAHLEQHVAEGARISRDLAGIPTAMMTGTRVASTVVSAVSDLLGNRVLDAAMQANLERLGAPDFDAADLPFAQAIRATPTPEVMPPIPPRA